MTAGAVETAVSELDALDDGHHHLWCKRCHPAQATHPLGIGLGVPFTAVCGVRAVILTRHLSESLPPSPCPACVAAATCVEGHP